MARSLRLWLSLGLSALVSVAVLMLIGALLGVLVPRLNAEVEAKNRALGEAVTAQVETFLKDASSDLERLATDISSEPKHDLARLRLMIDTLANTDSHLEAIYVIDARNRVIDVGLPMARRVLRDEFVGADFSEQQFVHAARESRHSVWSDTYLSQRGEIVVAVIVPLPLSNPGGVLSPTLLVGEFSLREVSRFSSQLARSGHVLPIIVDQRGRIVGHPDVGRSLRQENLSQLPQLSGPGTSQSQTALFRMEGIDYIGTTTPISGVGWTTLIAEPADTAFALVRSTLLALAAASLVALGFALIAAFFVSRRMSRQVAKFGQHLQLIAAGNYHATIPRSSTDEIEGLAQSMRHMAAAVLERESRLKLAATVLESSVEGIVITDAQRRIISVNPALLSITGFGADELVGKRSSIVDSPNQDRTLVRRVRASIKAEGFWRGEVLGQRKGSAPCHQAVTITAIRSNGGPITHYVASVFDISERKNAELALEQSNRRFRDLVESTDGVVWEADASTFIFNYVSNNTERLLGYPVSDWLQPGFWADHIYVEDRQYAVQYCAACTGRLENHDFEYRFVAQDGRVVWLRDIVRVLEEDGKPRWLRGLMIDITAQKMVEQKMLAGQKLLHDTALHKQTILDTMADAVITINADGVMDSFNQAACRIFGYGSEEVMGLNVAMLMPEPHRSHHDGYLQHFQATGEARVVGRLREVEGRRKNGSVFPISLAVSKLVHGDKTTFVGLIRDITRQRADEDEIRRLAHFDFLTELPNRRLLMDRLKQAMLDSARTSRHGALILLDLDNFKVLNDSQGHLVGDLLLQQVAKRLVASVREGDSVARLGGDEFVVLLTGLSTADHEAVIDIETITNKILLALEQPFELQGCDCVSTASIGIVLFMGEQDSKDELLKKADVAMYQAKATGRNRAHFFDPDMRATALARTALGNDLRSGLTNKEFFLHYQVQVDRKGGVTGVEALVRWKHPKRGNVSPGEFIPLAEETGLILRLGQWVLETACLQLAAWAKEPRTAQWTMAVNVSSVQFVQADFVAQVDAALLKSGANPMLLKLELTESMLVKDVDDVIAKMTAIKARGASFSLDDFGTGYSSLSYLKRLPLAQLKIDQSFVRDLLTDPGATTIAATIVTLGQSLGYMVIAEGVETLAQWDLLASMGCHAYQGYYFGRPVAAESL